MLIFMMDALIGIIAAMMRADVVICSPTGNVIWKQMRVRSFYEH
jgi:hypothetical protein